MNQPTGPRHPRHSAAQVDFLAEMLRELERIYNARRIDYGLACDAISLAKERVLPRLDRVIADYGSGGRYAAAISENLRIDAYRSGNAQRGAGFGKTRDVTALDDSSDQAMPFIAPVEEEFESSLLVRAMLGRMTADEQRDFLRVHVEGFNYTEIGELNHEAHTTSMRRVKRANEKARLAAIEFLGFDPSLHRGY
ncbi:MAG: hypothetical protein ACKOJC_05225 [Actinomycetota bacterium]